MNIKTKQKKKAIFLDRDGVIIQLLQSNESYGLVYKKEDLIFLPNVKEALQDLKKKGYLLIVFTNQPAVARGLISYEGVEENHSIINKKLNRLIDKFYFCPHHPEMHSDVPQHAVKYRISCDCRKPAPGMLIKAAEEFNIDFEKSWVIGDSITDIAAGDSVKCRTILIKSKSNERINISAVSLNKNVKPHKFAESLSDAVKFID